MTVHIYLQQIAYVPFLAYHIVVSFSATQTRWLRMYDDFLDHKPHTFETFLIGTILPYSIVIYFVHTIDKAYLKARINAINLL